MKIKHFTILYIDYDYITMLNEVDQRPESITGNVYCDKTKTNNGYKFKPYIGILTENNMSYAIPMTSAKEHHRNKPDVFDEEFNKGVLVYRYVDITKLSEPKDGKPRIFVDLPDNHEYFQKHPEIEPDKRKNYKKWITNVCDINKMIPIPYGVSRRAEFRKNINNQIDKTPDGVKRHLKDQYDGIKKHKTDVEKLASKMYNRQMNMQIIGPKEPDLDNLEIASIIWKDYLQDSYDAYIDHINSDYMFNAKTTEGNKKEPKEAFLKKKYGITEMPRFTDYTISQHNKKQKTDFEQFIQKEYGTDNIKKAVEIFKEAEKESEFEFD